MAKVQTEKREVVGKKGVSDVATLRATFLGTPEIAGYTNLQVGTLMKTLTHGIQDQNPEVTVDLDFGSNATTPPNDIQNAQNGVGGFGGAGKPASPYAPAVGSPGAGSTNPADIPNPPAGFGTIGSELDSKQGSTANPADISKKVAGQQADGGAGTGLTKQLGNGESYPMSHNS